MTLIGLNKVDTSLTQVVCVDVTPESVNTGSACVNVSTASISIIFILHFADSSATIAHRVFAAPC